MRDGRQIMQLVMAWFTLIAAASAARADPVSIRCTAGQDKDAYFVTYDVQTSRFIFEKRDGVLTIGEIAGATDQRLQLRLKAKAGPVPLVFDRPAKVMQWPGIAKIGLPTLTHSCMTTADRTVLSLIAGPYQLQRRTPVDAFSIRCHGAALDFFITMDRSTKAVLMETEAGTSFSGEIDGGDGVRMRFAVGAAGKTVFSGTWDEQAQQLTENDPSHPPHSQRCIAEKARSIMEVYDRL